MVLEEIKKPSTNFIRIKKYGETTISTSLVRRYFLGKKVRVFHDGEKKMIGLQPSDEGYKIYLAGKSLRFACRMLPRIILGEFYPTWSDSEKMLVFSYG